MVLGATVALAAMFVGAASAGGPSNYQVTINNLTSGQPLSPPIVVAHTSAATVWATGEPAPAGVQTIAETGDPGPLAAALEGVAGVVAVETFGGPILAGASSSIEISAPAGSLISVVTMLICTNDGFTGVSGMVLPSTGMTSMQVMAYDAGTELNSELTVDIVDPCGGAGPVAHDADGNERTGTTENIAAHGGITGMGDLSSSDHGWTGAVASIDVTIDQPGVPTTGSGLQAGGGSGDSLSLLFLVFGAAIVGGSVVTLVAVRKHHGA